MLAGLLPSAELIRLTVLGVLLACSLTAFAAKWCCCSVAALCSRCVAYASLLLLLLLPAGAALPGAGHECHGGDGAVQVSAGSAGCSSSKQQISTEHLAAGPLCRCAADARVLQSRRHVHSHRPSVGTDLTTWDDL